MIRASPLFLLGLSKNLLSGSIPPSMGNLSSLQYLYLAENNLEGSIPESLGKIPGLEVIDLSINNLSGRMPPPLYNLSSLAYLGVGGNRLFGTLPPDLGVTLPNLQSLVMQSNLFHGPIPASLYNASKIQMLDLAMNSFKGLLSPSVGSLKNLVELNLGSNQLQANVRSVLYSLTNCTLLERLYLQHNKLEGTLQVSIGNLSTKLENLLIGGNQISGTVPLEIGKLVSLTVLFMNKNLFTGSVPPTIGRLQNLIQLDISGNKFSGPIPSSIGNLTQLNELYMQDNELSSNIPASAGECRNLNILNLSNNALVGPIPKELVALSSLARALDLSYNNLSGPIPMEVGSLINLDCLNVSNNRLSGEIPSILGACQHLEYLHLEGNFFRGSIPQSFISLRGVKELDLSRNNLSGRIPEFFGSFSSLQYLNLSFNDLEGEVPKDGVFGNSSETFVLGNKRLCGGDPKLQLPPCSIEASKRNIFKKIIIIASVAAILFLCFLVILLQLRKGREKSPSVPSLEDKYRMISYTDILKATDGFSSANLVGTGSSGFVYKGKLDGEEKFVAVKVFNIQQVGALESFKTECEIIRNVRHYNLVKIITSCSSMDSSGNDFKALIFEYMPNGSLEEWLHPRAQECDQTRNLNLTQRLNIALDVASALCYLHHNIEVPAIHCDLKPSNVLLDNDMTAHVGDFGLARFLSTSGSTTSEKSTSLVGIKGTIGYVAPEYAMGSQISTQGDVYSYGILLLEMLTGKKPTNNMFKDGLNLHKFVDMAFPESVMEILDPQILQNESEEVDGNIRNDNFSRMQLRRCIISLIRIGLLCSKESPNERPRMRDVTTKVRVVKEMSSIVEINEEGANLPE
uniref:Receptor kinase-like protein Xa21 n=2 Tax=Elaeis guineensis var. tenera TaxID=51953 RepID=A0A6I9RPR6_ELAGV|nr:putative receptor-like protein kinase At3g47110 [Elaeis guineensis]